MNEKIGKIIFEFYDRFMSAYALAYFSWLTEKLSGTEPFAMLAVSVFSMFVLITYLWFRNRNG